MIDVDLPLVIGQEFISLIPHQRAHINHLMEQGIVLSYSLSIDRSKLWIVLRAKGEGHAMKIMEKMPMYSYFQVTAFPLAFHNHVSLGLPETLPN